MRCPWGSPPSSSRARWLALEDLLVLVEDEDGVGRRVDQALEPGRDPVLSWSASTRSVMSMQVPRIRTGVRRRP